MAVGPVVYHSLLLHLHQHRGNGGEGQTPLVLQGLLDLRHRRPLRAHSTRMIASCRSPRWWDVSSIGLSPFIYYQDSITGSRTSRGFTRRGERFREIEKDLDRRKHGVENYAMLDDRLPLVLARERLEARGRVLRRGPLDPANVRETLRVIDRGLADLHSGLGPQAVGDEQAFLIRQSMLQAAFLVLLLYQQGEPRAAWSLFLGLWRQIAEAFGVRTPHSWFSELGEAPVPYLMADTAEI